ncbi:adenylyl-sulfate kinase [Nitriliruptor alkaliphilus]|uniref:adenylyl-sulfate kinase n=1 Tax=Nitriliruptor alkaliphilus TaxID=427918 RepID=UPI00069681DD|nr:adenylyl-sulfate kinase [Nitriliruptor alkaliphilus]
MAADDATPAAEPRSRNIVRAEGHVTAADRRRVLGHGPATVWFTGLSGSGKSTLAFAVERALIADGIAAYVLDGDNVRFGLNRDLGFSPADRTENIRRIGEVCRLMHDAGLVVLTAFISPYRTDRQQVRDLHPDGGFVEVFVDTPIEICEARDVKGLYARARAGEVPEFSGVSAPYEAPDVPELRLDTSQQDLDACVAAVRATLDRHGLSTGPAAGGPAAG